MILDIELIEYHRPTMIEFLSPIFRLIIKMLSTP